MAAVPGATVATAEKAGETAEERRVVVATAQEVVVKAEVLAEEEGLADAMEARALKEERAVPSAMEGGLGAVEVTEGVAAVAERPAGEVEMVLYTRQAPRSSESLSPQHSRSSSG